MLQRGDDAAEGAFAGPAIFNDLEFTVEVTVFLGAGDNGNFRGAGLRELNDLQQQWGGTKADEGFVAAKPRTSAPGENIPAHV